MNPAQSSASGTPGQAGQGAAPRKWLVMASVAAGIFLGTIDASIVNIALPVLEREFDAGFAAVQWVVLVYLLVSTALLPAAGRLADMVGKKYLYVFGFAVFTAGSVLCGLSSSVSMLIAFRVVQAAGGAVVIALGAAIVTETFPPAERGRALGINGAMVSIGLVSGPTIGGLILSHFSWHYIFLVNLPIGLAGIYLSIRYVPDLKPAGGRKFDFAGAALLFASLFTLLLGLTTGQKTGFADTAPLCLFAAAAASGVLFIAVEHMTAQPLIDLGMFGDPHLGINLATGFITFFCAQSTVLLMPFFLQNVMGYAPRDAGLLLATVPITMGIAAPLAGMLSDRIGTRVLTAAGLAFLFGGYVAVGFMDAFTSAAGFILMFLPIGIGAGLFQSPNNSAIMGAVPRDKLGVASGLVSLIRVLGVSTGMAVLGAFWAAGVGAISGEGAGIEATRASAYAQIESLHRTLMVAAGLILLAFIMSLVALWIRGRTAEEQSLRGQ